MESVSKVLSKITVASASAFLTSCAGMMYTPEYNDDGSFKINPEDFSLYEIAAAEPVGVFAAQRPFIREKFVGSRSSTGFRDGSKSERLNPSTLKGIPIDATLPRPDGDFTYRVISPDNCKFAYSYSKVDVCRQAVTEFNAREEQQAIEAVKRERARLRAAYAAREKAIQEQKRREEEELERKRKEEEKRRQAEVAKVKAHGYSGYQDSFLGAYLDLVEKGNDISGIYIEPDNWADTRVHVVRVDGNRADLIYDDQGLRYRSSDGRRSSFDLPLIVIHTKGIIFEGKNLANYYGKKAFTFVRVSSTLGGRQTVIFKEVDRIP